MVLWCNQAILITQTPPQELTDGDGFDNPMTETTRTVFCNVRSITETEFYKATAVGKEVKKKIEVHKFDYEGETLVQIVGEDKRYSVLKTYEQPYSDVIELTLTDLPTAAERG